MRPSVSVALSLSVAISTTHAALATEARCTDSIVNVAASATNYDTSGAPNLPVSGTFGIQLRFCEPTVVVPSRASTIQVLVHGITYNTAYWDSDVKPEIYSYARFASRKGYATLNLARLGYGLSDHPDPVNVVQYPLSAAIIIELIRLARSGGVPGARGHAFNTVVYVGHSAGSIIGNGLVEEAPDLINAAALTGFSHSLSDVDLVTLFGIQPAALNDPARFGNLSSDYLTTGNATNREISFYSAAGTFEPEALAYDEAHKDTSTTGEALTTGALQGVAPAYTGHVLSIAGDGDIVFCPEPDCANLEKEQEFYPNAASFETGTLPDDYCIVVVGLRSFNYAVVPSTGHSLNFHKSAPVFYDMIQDWLNRRGL